ncbi:hypothetical protein F5141DRAFT_1250507 [Pisolithus sp. B1]|nr:hypothetical protein F5141DRAFT_1250507 [Pisolithus sp. B1]
MSRPRRRTAVEVTFPEEAASLEESTGTSDVDRKSSRRGGDQGQSVAILTEFRNFISPKVRGQAIRKNRGADYQLFGEEPHLANPDDRHVRMLSHFAFFDPSRDLEMVSLNVLDTLDGRHHEINIEGAGFTAAKFDIEDQSQQHELEGYCDEDMQYIHLTTVRQFIINYLDDTHPVCVETDHAIYELLDPSKKYQPEYRSFYKPQRVMQLVISSTFKDPDKQFPLVERDMWDAVPKLKRVLETIYYADRVRESDTVSRLLSRDAPKFFKMVDVMKLVKRSPPIPDIEYKGNLELMALRPEKHAPTCVTRRSVYPRLFD